MWIKGRGGGGLCNVDNILYFIIFFIKLPEIDKGGGGGNPYPHNVDQSHVFFLIPFPPTPP